MRYLILATLLLTTPAIAQDTKQPDRTPCAGFTSDSNVTACYVDPGTGCEYLVAGIILRGLAITPRLSGAGRPICTKEGRK